MQESLPLTRVFRAVPCLQTKQQDDEIPRPEITTAAQHGWCEYARPSTAAVEVPSKVPAASSARDEAPVCALAMDVLDGAEAKTDSSTVAAAAAAFAVAASLEAAATSTYNHP